MFKRHLLSFSFFFGSSFILVGTSLLSWPYIYLSHTSFLNHPISLSHKYTSLSLSPLSIQIKTHMKTEPSSPVVAKKLWNTVRIVFYMLRKGVPKSKLMLDIHLMLKRGKLASKSISDLMLQHHYPTTLSCGSTDVAMSLVYPREYEFSCSNSPVYPSYNSKRKHRHHHHHHHRQSDDKDHKVFDTLSNYESVEASPMMHLPGFGRSPMVRQTRVTDSPYLKKDVEENNVYQVDKEAEDFIMKFYMDQWKQQKMIESSSSPSPYHAWGKS